MKHQELTDAVARFQGEVMRIAIAAARDIIARSLATAAPEVSEPPAPVPPPAPVAPVPPPQSTTSKLRRTRWTPESVLDELAQWISKGSIIDDTYVNSVPGMAAAARRHFGRIDVAITRAYLRREQPTPPKP